MKDTSKHRKVVNLETCYCCERVPLQHLTIHLGIKGNDCICALCAIDVPLFRYCLSLVAWKEDYKKVVYDRLIAGLKKLKEKYPKDMEGVKAIFDAKAWYEPEADWYYLDIEGK